MVRTLFLLLLLTGLLPSAVRGTVLNNSDSEYLGVLNQKGTQIIVDILEAENALDKTADHRADVSVANCLAQLRSDMRVVTLEGDHLQTVVAIARRMVDPADRETVLLFTTTIAEAASQTIQPLRDDVNSLAGRCPAGEMISSKVKQVLSFLDDFANVVHSISRRSK